MLTSLLKHWWTGTPQANDRFTFTADPGARLIEVPLLFAGSGGTTGFSHAYTTNHVNLLSAADSSGGTTAYVGYSHGPLGSYLPGQPANANLFDDYVSAALHMGGYESVVFADSRMYHIELTEVRVDVD